MKLNRWKTVVAARVHGRSQANAAASLWRDQSGGAALLAAFAMPVFLGALGVGVDTGAWYIEKHRVQQQADAAALGTARMLGAGQDAATAQAGGIRDAGRSGYVAASG